MREGDNNLVESKKVKCCLLAGCIIPAEEIGALVRILLQCLSKCKGRQSTVRETQNKAHIRKGLIEMQEAETYFGPV